MKSASISVFRANIYNDLTRVLLRVHWISIAHVAMAEARHVYFSSFVAGVLVTVALTEIYHRYQLQQQPQTPTSTTEQSATRSTTPEDEKLLASVRHGPPAIVDGVEGCIGNTPLFRIKSLSEATGCEILAKAEVGYLK